MNPRFFESLEGRGLGVRQSRLGVAFGENPTSAARAHQQEFNRVIADSITNCGDLLTFAQLTKIGQWNKLRGRISSPRPPNCAPWPGIRDVSTHRKQSARCNALSLETSLVQAGIGFGEVKGIFLPTCVPPFGWNIILF
jgi:hypothetical protein